MARIETYQRDNLISDSDIVIGSDGDNLNITKNYTIGQLKTYFTEGLGGIEGGGVDTNFYLNGISTDENYLVTFSIVGTTDQTLQLGSAAFAETTDFVSTSHTHVLADITDSGSLAALNLVNNNYIDKTNAGTVGQVLSLAANGQFTWINSTSADSIGADELNIGGTPSDGDVITYNSGNLLWATRNFLALSDTPAAFGATGALLKVNATADGLEFFTPNYAAGSHTHTLSEITDSGDLAALNLITTSELDTVNIGTNAQVLALDSNLDLQWVTVSAASGIALTDLSVTQNSSGTAALTYNNSTGVFSYTPPDLSGYALTSHTHSLSDITDSGALAALNTITPAHITVTGTPTTDKVLGWSDANTFAWVDQTGGGATYTEGNGIDISVSNVISVEDNLSIASLTTTGDVAVGNDLTVAGDFTVTGVTTTVNSTSLSVANRFIELNSGLTTTNINDSGLIIERGTLPNAVLLWDESLDKFIVGTGNITATTSDANTTYTFGDMQASTFHGALSGNASTASKWQTARTYRLIGDVTASLSIQGDKSEDFAALIGNDRVTKSKLKGLSNETAELGKVVVSDGNDGFNLVNQNTITGAGKAFTDLTDTPSSLTADNFVKVNSAGNALEYLSAVAESHLDIENDPVDGYVLEWDSTANKMQWVPQSGGGVSNFTALTDTPSAYTGNDGKVAFVDESNSRLVFRHITFNDIYDAGGNDPIGYPPNDGQTYVLTGTTTGGTDDYEWVLESEIVSGGGGTVVITDPTATYVETSCGNRSEYNAQNALVTDLYHDRNFTAIAYYNGYLYAMDRYGNRYKSTTFIEDPNYDIGNLKLGASWAQINSITLTSSEIYPTNLVALPSTFYNNEDSFAFLSTGTFQTEPIDEINYINISDFEDASFVTTNATKDIQTSVSNFGPDGNKIRKLIYFGGYLWAVHAYSVSYTNSGPSSIWGSLVFRNDENEMLLESGAPGATSYLKNQSLEPAPDAFNGKLQRLQYARNRYKFNNSYAASNHVLLLGCYASVMQIKYDVTEGSWVLNNIGDYVANFGLNLSNQDNLMLIGLDYSDEGTTGKWFAVTGVPTNEGIINDDEWCDWYKNPHIHTYAESLKDDTQKMTTLYFNGNNSFSQILNLFFDTTSYFIGQSRMSTTNDWDRIMNGNPGHIAARAGFLYFVGTTGTPNGSYPTNATVFAKKWKIADTQDPIKSVTIESIQYQITGTQFGRLMTMDYQPTSNYSEAQSSPIKIADKVLFPLSISSSINSADWGNTKGNIYLTTQCS